jgi:hypothetical protein
MPRARVPPKAVRLAGLVAAAVAVLIASVLLAPGTQRDQTATSSPPKANPSFDPANGAENSVLVLISRGPDDEQSSVVALDVATARVLVSYATGLDPAAAVSRTGKRLYVASGIQQSSNLEITDLTTGRVERVAFANRWLNTLAAHFATIALSLDERWLYALKHWSTGPQTDVYTIAVFDTQAGRFLEEELPLAGCIAAVLLPSDSTLDVACPHTGIFLSFPILPNGSFGPPSSLQASDHLIMGAVRVPGTGDVLLVTDVRGVVRVKAGEATVAFRLTDGGGDLPAFGAVAISPDGSRLFVGLGGITPTGRISTIEAYDIRTGARTDNVRLPSAAWSIALNDAGTLLYAPANETKQLFVLDARDLHIVETFEMSGYPAMVVGG